MNYTINNKIATSCLLIALFAMSCSQPKEKKQEQPDVNAIMIDKESLTLMDIQFTKPEMLLMESNIYLSGKVVSTPNNRASVSSDIEGKVEKIFVMEGNFVKKGAPLILLRSMALIELQNQYFEAKSQLDFLNLEHERQAELIKNNIGALMDFQNIDAKHKAAMAKVKALKAKLHSLGLTTEFINNTEVVTNLTISSPIDGYVFLLPVQLGVLATTEMTLAEIVNNSELMADVFVYDKDLDNIVEGQSIEIDFITHSYPSVTGVVSHISRAIDTQTKAVTVHVKFQAPPGKMVLPEMSIRCVAIKKESQIPKLSVPLSAILDEGDYSFVYLVFDTDTTKTLRKHRVYKGSKNEHWVQITFANEPKGEYQVVSKNVMIIENERIKRKE